MEAVVVSVLDLRRAVFALFAAVACAAAGPALAWGDLGHRVAADLAYERLTPAAKAQVDGLIRNAGPAAEPSCPIASLADAAVFPDCVEGISRFNALRRLHYDPAPFCGMPPKPDWCKDGRCASEAAKRAAALLADPTQTPAARLDALAELAHFVADLHAPLNMIDNRDDHGEEIRITLPGSTDRRLNLHGFWNDVVLAPALGSEEQGVRYLEPVIRGGRDWAGGGVDDWALETRMIARSIYERLPEPPTCNRNPRNPEILDRGYVLDAVAVTRAQVAKAGVRLADLLNATLR